MNIEKQIEEMANAYYELACEVEDLRAENERLRAEEKQSQIFIKTLHDKLDEGYAKFVDEERAEAINEFAERLKKYYNHLKGSTPTALAAYHIDQIKEEMLRGDSDDNT